METELRSIGLSDKEVRVYLGLLDLGQGTVQEIAKKAGIPRPTAHLALEELIKEGLVSSHEQKNKRILSAEFPERLLRLIEKNEEELKIKRSEINRILPKLKILYKQAQNKPRVRFFEGKEGIKAIQDDYLRSRTGDVIEIFPQDDYEQLFSSQERLDFRKRLARKNIKVRTFYTHSAGPFQKYPSRVQAKHLTKDKKIMGDILIYENKIAMVVFRGKPIGILIESKEIAETLRTLFDLAWKK